jgi:GR25 family glycosyltransferase involved in LPS biosynthesis
MFLRILLLIIPLCGGALFADLTDHLKKPLHKGTGHSIKNVDFIYIINLDKRPEKFASCVSQLKPYGIKPYRFSAVNGWELSLETLNDLGVKYKPKMGSELLGTYYPMSGEGKPVHEKMNVPGRSYFSHCMSLGAIGCALSHISVLKDALDSKYKTIWLMEDDIQIKRNPHLISKYISKLDALVGKKGWDMLFTDQDTISNATGNYIPCRSVARRPNFSPEHPERFAQRQNVDKRFRKIGTRYGMYSVIIRRSGMKKIFNFIQKYKIFLPIDMDFCLPSDMRIFTVRNDIVSTQRYAPSDNGKPGFRGKN